ncbi:MAG TPA: Ig-like domain-containing protein, partial [Chthoniobacterales bacterium]
MKTNLIPLRRLLCALTAGTLIIASQAFAAPVITATKDDGVPAATKKNPGDQITYTIGIGNSGSDATNVTLTDGTPANTTDVSLAASPVGVDDTYPQTVIGNVSVNSAIITYSVAANDYLGANPAATIDQVQAVTAIVTNTITATTAQGGTVVMTVSGSGIGQFTYNPPAGYTGTDTFTYRLSDNANASSASSNRTATVTIPISGMVWFINNNAGAGDGRLSSPFNSLAAFQAVNDGVGNHPAAGDNIFIYESSTAYTGPVTLLDTQKLIGQDATASLSTITGLTPPTSSAPFPTTDSGNATIVTITSASDAIKIANTASATIRGLTIGNTTGSGIANAGATFGTLNVSDISDTGTGQILNLTSGTLNATYNTFSSSSSTNAVNLVTVNGSVTVNNSSSAISGG